MTWHAQAACRDHHPEHWFPHTKEGADPYGYARHICGTCPVRHDCLEAGLQADRDGHGAYGMWGGLTPSQRSEIHRQRRKATA